MMTGGGGGGGEGAGKRAFSRYRSDWYLYFLGDKILFQRKSTNYKDLPCINTNDNTQVVRAMLRLHSRAR